METQDENFIDLIVYAEKTVQRIWNNQEDEIWNTL
jgi:hypothetical protein